MTPAPPPPRSLFWFRKGLRLHDNPSLWAAIKDAKHLYPVFVLDPWFLKPERVGVNRLNFLLQSLSGRLYAPEQQECRHLYKVRLGEEPSYSEKPQQASEDLHG